MTTRLIRLRFLQLYRGSGDLGLFRVMLMVVVLLPLFSVFLVQRIRVHPWQFAIPAMVLYIVWMVHNNRKDYHVLLAIMPNPKVQLLAEYFLFTIPVILLLLSAQLYPHAFGFCIILMVIAFTVPRKAAIADRTMNLKMIPDGMFEWHSGIRKNLVVLILFYIPGLFGFYQVWLSATSLVVITLIFISFYSEYEPLSMLDPHRLGPWKFLMWKVVYHGGGFALILLPLLLSALLYGEFHWIIFGYFLASVNLVAFSILLKYYQYRPAAFSGAHQLLTMLAGLISVILPVAVVFLLFNLVLAAGATGNLKKYLYGSH